MLLLDEAGYVHSRSVPVRPPGRMGAFGQAVIESLKRDSAYKEFPVLSCEIANRREEILALLSSDVVPTRTPIDESLRFQFGRMIGMLTQEIAKQLVEVSRNPTQSICID